MIPDAPAVFSTAHPVAAVLGSSRVPYDYNANNTSTVLSSESESEEDSLVCKTTSNAGNAGRIASIQVDRSSHLIWKCAISASADADHPTIHLSAMFDNGSDKVLIDSLFAEQLGLR
jgi:hypothetical protein